MSIAAFSSLPLLPPPFTSILSTTASPGATTGSSQDHPNHQNFPQRRQSTRHQQKHPLRHNPNSLHALLLDESAIASRKAAIATYGYSWLRPAGVAKTMLGRKEEEAEREEVDRQMREQEEMEQEVMRLEALRAQNEGEGAEWAQTREGEDGVDQERDLDAEIPDADADAHLQDEEHDYENRDDEGDADLDDEIPDAEEDFEDEVEDEDGVNGEDVEGETGITDEVEQTRLEPLDNSSLRAIPSFAGRTDVNMTSSTVTSNLHDTPNSANARRVRLQAEAAAQQAYRMRHGSITGQEGRHQQQNGQDQEQEHEVRANAILEHDEQDLDANIHTPEEDEYDQGLDRDLDDDIDEAEGPGSNSEGDWQHTDTELELELQDDSMASILPVANDGYRNWRQTDVYTERDDDASMDMSGLDEEVAGHHRRASRSIATQRVPITPATVSTADGAAPSSSSIFPSPVPADATSTTNVVSRGWLNRGPLFGHAASAKPRNRLTTPGNLFSSIETGNDIDIHNVNTDSQIVGEGSVASSAAAMRRSHGQAQFDMNPTLAPDLADGGDDNSEGPELEVAVEVQGPQQVRRSNATIDLNTNPSHRARRSRPPR